MIAKLKEKVLVRELREKGLSYGEIKERIPVSKSSISLWCRDIKLTGIPLEQFTKPYIRKGNPKI